MNLAIDPELPILVDAALRRLAPECDFTLDRIDERVTPRDAAGRTKRQVIFRISTSSRPGLLGQFPPFSSDQLRGYYPNYVFGYLHGWYAARYGRDLWSEYELVLDVANVGESPPNPLCKSVPVTEAMARGIVPSSSPLAEALGYYRLPFVLMAGSTLSGPSLAMITTVTSIVRRQQVSTILDLFAGTCALTSVAFTVGARCATCVDVHFDLDKVHATLGNREMDATLIKANAGYYDPGSEFDLVICDPFYDFTREVVQDIIPRYLKTGATVVVNLGPPEPKNWSRRLLGYVESIEPSVAILEQYGEIIAVLGKEVP